MSKYSPKVYLLELLRQKPRSWIARKLRTYVKSVDIAVKNLSYDLSTNGEAWLIESLESYSSLAIIFDVGANIGNWALVARSRAPDSTVFCFEIAPQTFRILRANCVDPKIRLFDFGLGEKSERRTLEYVSASNTLSTLVRGFSESFHKMIPEIVEVRVMSGDDFCTANNIEHIDFLKIDAEGFEPAVLAGFDRMIGAAKIRVIQFEYGRVNIITKFLLKDFYEFFEERGYIVGKLFPDHVNFKAYEYSDEDFYGPNYVAVLKKENKLIELLSGVESRSLD